MTPTSTSPSKGQRILGAICWNELHTRDVGRARAFYEKVVGWRTHDCGKMADGGAYVEWVRADGAHVGAMMTMQKCIPVEVPPHWAIHINVEDVDATVRKAMDLGGTTCTPPFDVPNVGRIAGIADPTGAVFHVIKGIGECGSRVPQTTPGSFCWTELLTSDPDACKRFYGALFGWTTTTMKMPETEYTLLWLPGGDPERREGCVGGLMKLPSDWGSTPSNWMSYIMVDDLDAATERIKSHGGEVKVGPMEIQNVGRFTVAVDPTGATFALFVGS